MSEEMEDMGEQEEVVSSKPSSATSRSLSRLSNKSLNPEGSRSGSRLSVSGGSRPGSRLSASGSRPSSAEVVKSSRPSSSVSKTKSRPSSAKSIAWEENEATTIKEEPEDDEDDEEEEEGGHHEEDLGPLVIKGEDDIPKGCWFAFLQSFNGIWSTKDMNDDLDRENSVRTTVRELVVYMLFLMILVISMFGGTSAYRYAYTNMMQQHLEKFEEVTQVPELWEFLLDEWVPAIYEQDWYNDGDRPEFPCPDGGSGKCKRSLEDDGVLYDNKLLGVPRLRQLKVKNDSCEIHPQFSGIINVCYGKYNPEDEDRERFGPSGLRKFTSADAWRYQSPKELGHMDTNGYISTYSGGGSIQDLDKLRNNTEAILRELREYLWIDRSTRVVMLDFTVYNANVNLFCVIKLTFEFPPTGGLQLYSTFRTVKLLRYVSRSDYYVFAFEIIFICFVIYYMVEEVMEIRKVKLEYFSSAWNVMDCVVILISLFNIIIAAYTELIVSGLLKPLLAEPQTFGDFDTLSYWTEVSTNILAVNVFCSWLKLFKYISFNRTMNQLNETLARCAPDVIAFQFMFMIVFFAYAQYGYLLFGPKMYDFSKLNLSAYTLMRAMLGDFDFPAFVHAHKTLGPTFFIFYIFIVFFILLNMFLAIINDTYSEVKGEMEMTKIQFEITDLFARGYNNVLGSVSMRDKMIDVENAIKLANEDGTVTFEEIRAELKKCDFSNAEIEMFFGNSDKDGDGTITVEESNEDFVSSDSDSSDEEDDDDGRPKTGNDVVTNKEFDSLEKKVDKMEHSIGSIITKLDAVLVRIGVMQEEPEDGGNATFMLDITQEGEVEDFVPGDGTDGNATFV